MQSSSLLLHGWIFIDFSCLCSRERDNAETVLHEVCLRLRRAVFSLSRDTLSQHHRRRPFFPIRGILLILNHFGSLHNCAPNASVERKCRMNKWCEAGVCFFFAIFVVDCPDRRGHWRAREHLTKGKFISNLSLSFFLQNCPTFDRNELR